MVPFRASVLVVTAELSQRRMISNHITGVGWMTLYTPQLAIDATMATAIVVASVSR